jgi:DNA-binding HxlR family transcriptional regulator
MNEAVSQPRACSVARTLDIVGEKWALLAVREVFLGDRRFDEMVRRTGAPRDTLAARLRSLTGAGILERRQYSAHPARFEYHLTPAGRDLYPVIVTLMRWGDTYLAGDDGPPLVLEHTCGHTLAPRVVCETCGEPVQARDTRPVPAGSPGSGAADSGTGGQGTEATSPGQGARARGGARPEFRVLG